MLTTGGCRPSGMNTFTDAVYGVLEGFVLSPWNVLKVECGWRGIDPCDLDRTLLRSMQPRIVAHVARLTDEDNAAACCAALDELLLQMTPPPKTQPIVFDY